MKPFPGVFSPLAIRASCLKRAFCSCGGNLNASEEIIGREKKFSTFAPKMVHIAAFIGQFSTVLGIIAQSF
jgi:hypothetical protein